MLGGGGGGQGGDSSGDSLGRAIVSRQRGRQPGWIRGVHVVPPGSHSAAPRRAASPGKLPRRRAKEPRAAALPAGA